MEPRLTKAFAAQARAGHALASPFMAALMTHLPNAWVTGGALDCACAGFAGDLGPQGASVPLRIAGALHRAARAGRDGVLTDIYATLGADRFGPDLPGILARLDAELAADIGHAPQTNEVGRSAVLIAAARALVAQVPGPLQLWELGASAGLNLLFDRYCLTLDDGSPRRGVDLRPRWTGRHPPDVPLTIVGRRGVDLNPLSPVADADRLMSFVWPDHTARLARLEAALALARADPPQVDRGSAADWLAARLAEPALPGVTRLIFHTIAAQYFPKAEQDRIDALLACAPATANTPIARIAMEADGGTGAAVTLQNWPGGSRQHLGRAGFHGEWVDWQVA